MSPRSMFLAVFGIVLIFLAFDSVFVVDEREQAIVRARVPDVSDALLKQLVDFVQGLRDLDIRKRPSISETVDWARTLLLMHATELDEEMVRSTLNVLLKHESDIQAVDKDVRTLARAAASSG